MESNRVNQILSRDILYPIIGSRIKLIMIEIFGHMCQRHAHRRKTLKSGEGGTISEGYKSGGHQW